MQIILSENPVNENRIIYAKLDSHQNINLISCGRTQKCEETIKDKKL